VPSNRTAAADTMDEHMPELDRSVVGAMLARVGRTLLRITALLWRQLLRRPLDSIGIVAAAVASVAILLNALFLQASPHPAPMLPGKPRPVVSADATGSVAPMPVPRPVAREAAVVDHPASARSRTQIIADIQRELSRRGFFDGPTDGVYGAKTDAAIRDFEQAAGMKGNSPPDEALLRAIVRSTVSAPATPPAAAAPPSAARPAGPSRGIAIGRPAAPSRQVLAVQRALADFGYGQVKPNGMWGPETKAAIERFERERKLPVTGQISDRLTRELAAVTGRPLE